MSSSVLEKDSVIRFPHFMILKASAGSGKTYALTERFVQFILSEKINHNNPGNILAVTFSNNAAKEMKERILIWLKSICFDDPESTGELSRIISLDREKMRDKAGHLIEEILDNYSDFQVKTIDSFMTTVFKASAIDFGYNPEFEILMSIDPLMEYSFDRFLRDVREGTDKATLFEEIIGRILEQKKQEASYPLGPFQCHPRGDKKDLWKAFINRQESKGSRPFGRHAGIKSNYQGCNRRIRGHGP